MLSLAIIAVMCVSYFADAIFIAWLFEQPKPRFNRRAIGSVAIIATCIIIAYVLADIIPDVELGNRFQHALGGGLTAFLACFLACRDTDIDIGRIRFAVVALLIVTAMGVGNELLEFLLQTHSHYIFADNALDTWRDLASNAVGATIAAILLTPWQHTKRKSS